MTVIEATDEVLHSLGFARPDQFSSDGLPEFPQDPTLLSDEDVSCLYFAYVGWLAYAETERWVASTEHKTLEKKLNRIRAQALAGDEKGTVTAKKAAASLSPVVMDLEDELLAADSLRSALDDVCQRCERAKDAMSRELSRRGSRPSSSSSRSNKWA